MIYISSNTWRADLKLKIPKRTERNRSKLFDSLGLFFYSSTKLLTFQSLRHLSNTLKTVIKALKLL